MFRRIHEISSKPVEGQGGGIGGGRGGRGGERRRSVEGFIVKMSDRKVRRFPMCGFHDEVTNLRYFLLFFFHLFFSALLSVCRYLSVFICLYLSSSLSVHMYLYACICLFVRFAFLDKIHCSMNSLISKL